MNRYITVKELKDILKESYKDAKKKGLKHIPLPLVVYKILEKYLKGKGEEKPLMKWLSDLGIDRVDFLSQAKESLKDIMEDKLNQIPTDFPFPIDEENIVVDPVFSDTLERAQRQEALYFDSSSPSDPISTSAFMLASCWDLGEPLFEDVLDLFGITKNSFVESLAENFRLEKLKEKNIDSPSSVSVRMVETDDPEKLLGKILNTDPKEIDQDWLRDNGFIPVSGEAIERIKNNLPDFSDDKDSGKEEGDLFEEAGKKYSVNSKSVNPDSETPYLDLYSYDMTSAARMGKYDPVVGRVSEIRQMTEILCCRKKNNVVLLGDPGCGKTAVVELLAQKIIAGDVPVPLQNKRICSLDLNALVSGTKYRGEYEQRLQGIIKEVCDNPDIIVYIDEFHNLVGNGGSAGNGDGANILKPYLARGEFQCIGATTVDEYRKWIEKDGALKRRFQNVTVDEPNIEETYEILSGLAKKYGDYHKVRYDKEVIQACVDWTSRYVSDRFFPDKAIDCLDMAGSLAKLNTPATSVSPIDLLHQELEEYRQKKTNAMIENRFDDGARFKAKEREIEAKIESEKKKMEKKGGVVSEKERKTWPLVEIKDVAEVISKISKVPVDKISESEVDKVRDMKHALEKKVIGQDQAVQKITTALQRNFLGLRDPKKPIASLLFVGPTGTGKTLICKEMAKEFFGSEKALIKFDMAEFSERHEVTKLTGSTASYVGYDDSPLLEQVRRQPYSVVLFDEIEKAAPEIFNIFLSILDEGTVTLGNGQRVDFKNCIIVFTGNVGTKELAVHGKGLGFGGKTVTEHKKTQDSIVMKAVEKQFRPEFINRLSNITIFNELHKDEMLKIFDLEITKVKSRLKESGFGLTVEKPVKELCVSECDPKYGARDLQRAITRNIEDEICQAMISQPKGTKDLGKNISVSLSSDSKSIVVSFKDSVKKKKTTKKSESIEVETTSSLPEPVEK